MKPVRLEIIIDDNTAKGITGVEKNVENMTTAFKSNINKQKSFISELERQIRSLEKQISKTNTDYGKKQLIPSLLESERELKSAKQALLELEAEFSTATKSEVALRTQISKLRNEMASMTEGTDEYANALVELAQKEQTYRDITRQGNVLADHERGIKATADAVAGLSGALSAGVGIASLFGSSQEKLQVIQTRLQAVMATTIGLQQVANTLNKNSYFSVVLLQGAKKKWASAQAILNTQLGIGLGLSKAFLVTGIGFLIAGIASLVVFYDRWKKKQEELNAIKQEYIDIEIDTARAMASEKIKAEQLHKIASDHTKSLGLRNKAVNELTRIMPGYNGQINREGVLVDNANTALQNYLQTLYKVEKAKKLIAKLEDIDVQIEEAENAEVKGVNFIQKVMAAFASGNDRSGTLSYQGIIEDIKTSNENAKNTIVQDLKDKKTEFETELQGIVSDPSLFDKIFGDGKSESKAPENRLGEQRLTAMRRIREQEIALMKEGEAKRKAEAENQLKNRIEEIAKEKEEREKHLKELEKANIPISDQERVAINEQATQQALLAKKAYDEQIRQIDQDTANMYQSIQDELRLNFETRLNQELADIDSHYAQLQEKASENSVLLEQIELARNQAKQNAINEAALRELDIAEQLELQKRETSLTGLEMSEYVEREKNEIIIRYAQQRIEILKRIGDEQANNEIKQLEEIISGLQKSNSKKVSLKGIVDEKAIKSLTAHFVKLGDSEEDAKAKAEGFFTKFQGKMQLAADVTGMLQGVFGGVNEDLDAALNAVGNIASGFAQGGIAGGISAAASELVTAGVKWLTAKKEIDEETIKQYENYLSGMNDLIDKQISMLDQLGGDRFGQNIIQTVSDIQKTIVASRNLFRESMKEGAGVFRHSDGYKANKMLKGYTSELRKAGIYTTDLSKMSNDQLVKLKSMPEIYAKLTDSMRKYIDNLADSSEKLEEFAQQVQDAVLGFDFSEITSMIVDSMTDPSINNALDELTNNVNGSIAKMVKNMLARQMLIEPIKRMTESLFESMDKGSGRYELDINAAKLFTDGVKNLGEQYSREFEKLKEQFAAAGIDFDAVSAGSTNERKAVAKGIATASQESVDENNGRLTNIQMTIAKIERNQTDLSVFIFRIFDPITRIAENTDRLEAIENGIVEVKDGIGKIVREGLAIKR